MIVYFLVMNSKKLCIFENISLSTENIVFMHVYLNIYTHKITRVPSTQTGQASFSLRA